MYFVPIPVLKQSVLTDGPEVMTPLFTLEGDLHNTFFMREDGLVTVSKIETP